MSQLREIARDRAPATLVPGQPARPSLEPGRPASAEDGAATPTASALSARWPALAIALALAVLLAGVSAFLMLTRPDLLGTKPASVAAPAKAPGREMDLDKLATRLAARLEREGGDADAWALLGRAQQAIGKYPEAIDAFTRAMATRPNDADLLADLAEALMMGNGKQWSPEASGAVRRALQANPVHPKALALGAREQTARADYRAALQSWKRLESVSSGDPERAREAAAGMREANARLEGKAAPDGTPVTRERQ